jgi:hypothetical protein
MNENLGIGIIVILIGFVFIGGCFAYPQYNIYQQRAHGEAELAQAESSRQIATLEAKAKMESAKHLADAEVIRAKGVAEANKIIGDSLKDNAGYLKYLWIQGMQTNQMQVVYVPTESNLPILESTRWSEERAMIKGND